MTAKRLNQGGLINRQKLVRFSYDGKAYSGYEGDTLASALLASDKLLIGRSFKYHRPRGLLAAGAEEPNGLVQLEKETLSSPNIRATQIELYEGLTAQSQNAWPSINIDASSFTNVLSKLFPAGFYYKTFMWPASMWMTYEKVIRKMAGLGKVPTGEDPERYDHHHHYADIVVVGAGPAGLMAARAAAKSGADVMLVEQDSLLGGSLLSENATHTLNNQTPDQWLKKITAELDSLPNLTVLTRTSLAGYYDDNFLIAAQDISGHLPLSSRKGRVRQRLHKIRAKRVVIATGALERPLTFENNDVPGVMMADAVKTYINRYAVLLGQSIIIATNNDSAYELALAAHQAGASVNIVDSRTAIDTDLAAFMVNHGIAVHTGTAVLAARGKKRVKGAVLGALSEDGRSTTGAHRTLECDLIAVSGGFNPVVHLHSQARGKLDWRDDIQAFVPRPNEALSNDSAGACNGLFAIKSCLDDGWRAGCEAAKQIGYEADKKPRLTVKSRQSTTPIRMIWQMPGTGEKGEVKAKQFIDFQNDVTAADVGLAAREGFVSVEHLKRYTTMGMATDQGKTSNVIALALMAEERQLSVPEVGTTTFRPPYTPLPFGAMSGQHRDDLYAPVRTTPMHASHVAMGAEFEPVGDWIRAYYYPKKGENFDQAVRRECLAVRQNVGLFDGSTLGKIDIQGKDAAKFLNLMYTNAWLKLGINQCRYGLMLNENGMVYDDGVTTCIGENHYHMTTTTGGAARVLTFMEEWLQTEWPELEVHCTSVTEEWAVITLAGPKARDLLASLTDADVSNEAFPFMSMREANLLGVDARVFRISFSGELGYEINVPARFGRYLWDEIYARGKAYNITPYGTETMHVLRAEKGFIIVGQDTDGTVTPQDLGMGWIVNNKKGDFIGRRSFARSDTAKENRKQLVGLLPQRKDFIMPRGVHFVEKGTSTTPPFEHIGHASSRYFSPTLGRSFGLGLIKNSQARIGDVIYARTLDGKEEPVEITNPIFVDPEGGRVRG